MFAEGDEMENNFSHVAIVGRWTATDILDEKQSIHFAFNASDCSKANGI